MTSAATSSTGATLVPLFDLIADVKPGFAAGERDPSGVIQVRMNNVDTEGSLDLENVIRVPATEKQINDCSLTAGDVLFNNTNSTELVGKSAVFRGHPEPVTFSNHFTRLRAYRKRLDPTYLARWLTRQQQRGVFEGLCTRWVGQSAVRSEKLLGLKIPVPSLPEQRRIADILDKADAIRRKRRDGTLLGGDLPLSVFRETFKDDLRPAVVTLPLAEVAEVVSGVAKGRKFSGQSVREVPYLRVANVQAGYIDLTEIKTIPATEAEIEELTVQRGDVLLTEGGDHDKLGRGALWEHDVKECIHQNHIFRVRVHRDRLSPTFFVHYLQTEIPKGYFLQCAKKTTNFASINMRQLRTLPVPVPPLGRQERFENEIATIRKVTDRQKSAAQHADDLFHSLVQRAFRGEL